MSVRKIFYNTVLQSVGKLISVILGLATINLLTRYLGSIGFGEYTTVVSFMGFFGILADLGLYLITAQEISKPGADEQKILGSVFSLRLVSVVAMLAVGAAIAQLFPYSSVVKLAMLPAIIAFTFTSATQVLVGVFQKHLIFYQLTASEIFGRAVMLGTTWLFIRGQFGLNTFIVSLAIANAAHFLICWIITQRLTHFKLSFDVQFWKHILSKSWPLAFSVVLNLIYFKADTLILSLFKPADHVGLYGLSYKFLEVLLAFPAMFAGLIMPFLSRFAFSDWPSYRLYLQKSLDAIILAIVPMVVVVWFFARPIINLVGGEIYPEADSVLRILIFATAIIYVGSLMGYNVVALQSQKKMVWGYLTGTIVGLLLYIALIPRFSYYGAAIATVTVELTVASFAYILTSHIAGYFPNFFILIKALIAGLPMAGVFYYFHLPWVAEVVLGLIVYTIMLYLLKAIPKEFIHAILKKVPAQPTPDIINP